MADGGSGNWSGGNVTAADVPAGVPAGVPAWTLVVDHIQLAFALVGVLANVATMITLTVNGEDFSDIIKMLFKYQSALDCLCCLQAALLFSLQPMWKVGNTLFDTFICHVWHSQYLYWFCVDLSTYNLVTLALERYVCVCHPLRYMAMTKGRFRKVILGFFLLALFILSAAWFQTRMRDGVCRSEFVWDTPGTARFFAFFSLVAFFYAYFIPCAFFVVLYGLVIKQFRNRSSENLGASATSNTMTKASNELTKTAIVVTVIFMIALGFDIWYYLFAYLGVVRFILNSPIQKIGVFFSVINTVANPFLYASFMPLYRKSVKKTFFQACTKK